ncbi:hypothetical protein ACFFJ0_04240 [Sphingobium scionense]|uniref:NADH:ubiquinone oxidoreductase subunit 6 (Subunit J) n=2 Tax=Sphingobium scionense TaxID=1404341 RepID=A0A7W6LPM7_9SPHN|nr:hypothetical protein [Sphingobium scionense]MBB4147872.1 NADH:ubiquinone oxidoreductase subunit 6 (subunit J) [Sphingobium scionense]
MFIRNPTFWILNPVLIVVTAASAQYRPLAILSVIAIFIAFIAWIAGGLLDRPRFHAVLGDEWIEGETGVYSTIALWGGVLIAAAATDEAQTMPLFGIVQALVMPGAIGMMVSQLPLTRMFGQRS